MGLARVKERTERCNWLAKPQGLFSVRIFKNSYISGSPDYRLFGIGTVLLKFGSAGHSSLTIITVASIRKSAFE